jgi:hypothetical protein
MSSQDGLPSGMVRTVGWPLGGDIEDKTRKEPEIHKKNFRLKLIDLRKRSLEHRSEHYR